MPDIVTTENINQKAVIEKTLYMANHFQTQLQVLLKNGKYRSRYRNYVYDNNVKKAREELAAALEEFRYSFMSLYEMTRHKDRFSKTLDKRILHWINQDTNRAIMPAKYYTDMLKLYKDFVNHLATLKVIEK